MGFVANDEVSEFRQLCLEDLEFSTTPKNPDTTPLDTMRKSPGEHIDIDDETNALKPINLHYEHYEPAARHIEVDENYSDGDEGNSTDEDPYASLDPGTTLAIPVINPSAFPVERLREVQEGRQPSTHIADMLVHKTPSGSITQVTADIRDGSINHLFIRDPRIIDALGFAAPDYDTINIDIAKFRLDESFTIRVFSGQRPKKLENWIMGELVSARHAYLYWLDERQTADPEAPPFAAEARAIARKTGRRWPDVMSEIEHVWRMEQGRGGNEYRNNRFEYLGEDPTYPQGAEGRRVVRSMFR
ncbi:hypothetical protein E8E12_008826 [Didymella heteroderae]|uniref:Uncharacterized protein n=1 Tax=Didymella heteroderae TaxID=1769908 RepID=A0A9P4WT06_9PLEO|nr:hypothetical protein E8E12_008826 [Didymella heteroderae]